MRRRALLRAASSATRRRRVRTLCAAAAPPSVNVVDISSWTTAATTATDAERQGAVEAMCASFHQTGLCLITGHGVPAGLRQDVYDSSLEFFRQDDGVKDRFASKKKGTPGYMRMGQQSLGQTLSTDTLPADMNEFLIFSTNRAEGLDPAEPVVPTTPPQLPALVDEYTVAMNRLNLALMRVTAAALEQDTEFFVPFFTPGQYTLQMRYYPAQDPDFVPEPGQMRIGAHADSNGFTIVRLDGRPGLEVRIADSEGTRHWVPVSLPEGSPDALVVNTGRMIERWTGGHFKAAIHRVVLDGEAARSERMSLAFFSSPNTTARIETIGPAAHTAGYPPIIAKELQDAHYLAAYNQGDDDEAPVNEALRALGEKQLD